MATYATEFYKGRPAATLNLWGEGRAYYIASRNEPRFQANFYGHLIDELHLRKALGAALPSGVTAQIRTDGEREFVFLLGFNREEAEIDLGNACYRDCLTSQSLTGAIRLPPYTARVLRPIP